MRNPIRLKNLSLRFAPFYVAGCLLLAVSNVSWRAIGLGAIPIALGVAVRTWGCGHLIKNDRFTVTGPYAYLRHPLYLGTILVAIGFGIMLGGWSTLATFAFVLPWFALHYFPRKERIESQRLESKYGQVYRSYRDEVPALLPRLRAWKPATADAGRVGTDVRWSLVCYDANNELGTLLAVVVGVAGVATRAAVG
jgi:protein-S-isoprenylcysteine O-methyltransferase Ste14